MASRYLFRGNAYARLMYTRSYFPTISTNYRTTDIRFYSAEAEPLTLDGVTTRVIDVVKKFHKVDPLKVNAKSHFLNELGLDSLDTVELVMAIEDEFALEVPESEQESLVTVEAVINYVLSNPNAK